MENVSLTFAAIDKQYLDLIPELKEVETTGKDYVLYGNDNLYPEYLYGLYTDVSSLKTIIDGIADYVAGDDARCNIPNFEFEINRKGMTARELITYLTRDWCLYGGFAYQVVRNAVGDIVELYYLDFRYCRTDKYNEVIWYNEDFAKKWGRMSKSIVYPKFIPEARDVASSVVYVKNNLSTTYPIPRYSGALKACEIERHIDEYHLSALENGFAGSYLINFLNGIPTDDQKKEIEKNIQEKFAGSKNAGRIVLNFANGKDNAATLEKLEVEDFSDKYTAAAKRSREQIYCAFRAIPALFGLMSESTGFNEQEFEQAFKVFNKTVIKPIQRLITDTFDKVFMQKGSFEITPFTLNNTTTVE